VGKIAICLKAAAFGDDISDQLMEWLLLSLEQGYGAVYFSIYYELHPNVMKVLK